MGMSHDLEVAVEEGRDDGAGGHRDLRGAGAEGKGMTLGLADVLVGVGRGLGVLLQVYGYVLVARAVLSWVDADPRNPIVRFLHRVTDPPLRVIRGMLPMNLRHFPLDVAFLVLIAFVVFAQFAVAQGLVDAGADLRLAPAGFI